MEGGGKQATHLRNKVKGGAHTDLTKTPLPNDAVVFSWQHQDDEDEDDEDDDEKEEESFI